MEQTTNGQGTPEKYGEEAGLDVERLRAMAFDAVRNADVYVKRGKELVVRYPVYAVAGAVAAGFLFAKLVARNR